MAGSSSEPLKGSQRLLSKIAADGNYGENWNYFYGWTAYESKPHHPIRNPHGVLQMVLAENQVTFVSTSWIEEWIKKHPEASICTAQGLSKFREVTIFQDYHGLPAFRSANGVVRIAFICRPPIDVVRVFAMVTIGGNLGN